MIGSGFERRDAGGAGADGAGPTGPKLRVYELAKELGLANKELLDKVRGLGIEVANHMSHLEASDADKVRRALTRQRQETLVEERLNDTVIRRRSRTAPAPGKPAAPPAAAAPAPAPSRPAAPPPAPARVARPATPEPAAEPVVTRRREVVAPPPAAPPPPAREPERPAPVVVEARPKVVEPVAQPPTPPPPAPAPVEPAPAPKPVVAAPPVVVEAPKPVAPPPAVVTPPPVEIPAPAPAPVAAAASADPATEARVFKTVPQPVVTGSAATGQFIHLPGITDRNTSPGVPRIEIKDRDEELRRLGRLGMRPPGAPGGRDRYGRPMGGGPGQRPGAPPRKKVAAAGKKLKQTQITTPAEHKRVIKMGETIGVSELAQKMGVKGNEVIKRLWALGMMGVNINQSVDQDTATLIATEFGYQIESTAFREEEVISEAEADNPEDLLPRPPVVTIMGHVDHGKTSLLDSIRKANVAAGEAGGITQHIGAYRVHASHGDVVFLDTPGHEAFTAMRARGAKMTDIVVLVCAADDGPMPQTIEALNHAKAAEVPIIVAVNKIDKPGANPQMVRNKLMEHGLVAEEYGGDTIFIDVSAKTGDGIERLLEMLALQAEVLELKANPKKAGKGHVVEARLDRARGPISTLLVEDGTLKVGDIVVAGEFSGKIRAMLNDKGQNFSEAGPATPVEILGVDGVPDAGEVFNVVADEKAVKALVEHRREQRKRREGAAQNRGVTLENILDKIKEGDVKELKVILKADVQGSVEAIAQALTNLSTPTVGVNVISQGVGGITESDVSLAKASTAIVIGFNVRPAGKAQSLSEQEGVDIKLYQVIYDAIDDVKKAMVGMLAPVTREKVLGKAEVRALFSIPKIGNIAGCQVLDGKITRKAPVRLVRDSVVIYTGKLGSLRRFKDDVSEVEKGYECGLSIEGYQDLKEGDVIESFELETIAATLDAPIVAQGSASGNAPARR